MAEHERLRDVPPHETGEFLPIAAALEQQAGVLDSFALGNRSSSTRAALSMTAQSMRFGAEALRWAEQLLASSSVAVSAEPEVGQSSVLEEVTPATTAATPESAAALEVGQRGEWQGR